MFVFSVVDPEVGYWGFDLGDVPHHSSRHKEGWIAVEESRVSQSFQKPQWTGVLVSATEKTGRNVNVPTKGTQRPKT